MKGLVSRRQRVLRVRHVQHAMAVAETARARDEADGLARNIERLNKVRGELFETEGAATGASFAAMQELATRLEQAGRQLDGALYDARRKVEAREGMNSCSEPREGNRHPPQGPRPRDPGGMARKQAGGTAELSSDAAKRGSLT